MAKIIYAVMVHYSTVFEKNNNYGRSHAMFFFALKLNVIISRFIFLKSTNDLFVKKINNSGTIHDITV